MPKNILVGYDSSESARRAFLFAVELAAYATARVHVVSVLQTENGADTAALMMTDNGKEHLLALRGEVESLKPSPGVPLEMQVIHGSPGDALLAYVLQHSIDHVVVGHTERGVLARWLIGSTSTDVLAKSRVPVTIVR